MGIMKNELKAMFTEHWKYLAVNAACELNLFDKVFEGQDTVERLVSVNTWDHKSCIFLVDFLIDDNFVKIEGGKLILSEKGDLLREGNADGLYCACMNWSSEHMTAWQQIYYSINTGKSSFEKIYGKSFFNYLDSHPKKLHYYHKAMFEYARDDYKELPNLVDFSIHKSVIDIGGGYGAAISLIAQKYTTVKCFLFDLEKVINQTTNDRIKKIGGDFLQSIPTVSDAIILSRILHDWNDNTSLHILRNCFAALPDNGILYVIENCTDLIESKLSLLSLNMTAMCASFERSLSDYTILCEKVGFKFQTHISLNNLQTIIIFKK
jgi:hypothetical protein